ncbi:uncharacterized protein LOC131804387 [Musca domestica]|uniref:Uncharacterized protein LOC131804387 n=1 Tax=Musca domestica TaxID=7370 RepID=A0ABM3VBN2_MUSDO|nr:uncharacterized protein LOC131804387 [Musca domestica]
MSAVRYLIPGFDGGYQELGPLTAANGQGSSQRARTNKRQYVDTTKTIDEKKRWIPNLEMSSIQRGILHCNTRKTAESNYVASSSVCLSGVYSDVYREDTKSRWYSSDGKSAPPSMDWMGDGVALYSKNSART